MLHRNKQKVGIWRGAVLAWVFSGCGKGIKLVNNYPIDLTYTVYISHTKTTRTAFLLIGMGKTLDLDVCFQFPHLKVRIR